MAQSVKRPTLSFGSGLDLRVPDQSTVSGSLREILPLPLPWPPLRGTLSLAVINTRTGRRERQNLISFHLGVIEKQQASSAACASGVRAPQRSDVKDRENCREGLQSSTGPSWTLSGVSTKSPWCLPLLQGEVNSRPCGVLCRRLLVLQLQLELKEKERNN